MLRAYLELLLQLARLGVATGDGKLVNGVVKAVNGALRVLLIDPHGAGVLPQVPGAGLSGQARRGAVAAAQLLRLPSSTCPSPYVAPEQALPAVQPALQARAAAEVARADVAAKSAAVQALRATDRSAKAQAFTARGRRQACGHLFRAVREAEAALAEAQSAFRAAMSHAAAAAATAAELTASFRDVLAAAPAALRLLAESPDEATLAERVDSGRAATAVVA
ncbi:hypothetical protein HYH03_012762 [Edaphochlamys debaryana]|uniref:Uncharacterized protein n=1 Tax=Edaphochlamys debaryana TaxID=47281 RepID=A0A835Y048_9CHLO|nr:hypothetical protein HYH03_012762 [Edaphochlamys debaryana]|eukprot:KAG2488764.1 hypothetical protein HYH03_012762 [Edaphochlamys debaryana]